MGKVTCSLENVMTKIGQAYVIFGQYFACVLANFSTHLGKIFAELDKLRQMFWANLHLPYLHIHLGNYAC